VLGEGDEVDGVAAVGVVAGPAPPSFMSTVVDVHGDGWVLVVVVGQWAVPAAAAELVGGGHGEFVEEPVEVGAGEHVLDPPPRSLPTGHDMAWSVSKSAISARVNTVWATSPRFCMRHSARPRTSWPTHAASRSVRPNSSR